MTSKKISAMDAAASVGASDLIPIVQGGSNKKATASQLTPVVSRYTTIPFIGKINKAVGSITADDIVSQYESTVGGSLVSIQDNGAPAAIFQDAADDYYLAFSTADVTTLWKSVNLPNTHPQA